MWENFLLTIGPAAGCMFMNQVQTHDPAAKPHLSDPSIAEPTSHNPVLRVDFLDGVRGLAALYVAGHHAYMQLNWRLDGGGLSHPARLATAWLGGGAYGVVVFIVLSGFCLMLPVVRSPRAELRGGWRGYLYRRVKRIVPAYYAALLLSLLLVRLVPALSRPPSFFASGALPVTRGAVLAHVALIQNFSLSWFFRIDPPMWSVAVEFQIYFLFPSLLLPVYRRWGAVASVATAAAISYALHALSGGYLDISEPSFVALFAMGMAAAAVAFGFGAEVERLRRLPWMSLAVVMAVAGAVVFFLNPTWAPHSGCVPHTLIGAASAAGLTACAMRRSGSLTTRRLLESRWLVALGGFSYSLYLIHLPLESTFFALLRPWTTSPDLKLAATLGVGVPLACLAAYGFHLLFELPFLGSPPPKPGVARRTN